MLIDVYGVFDNNEKEILEIVKKKYDNSSFCSIDESKL